MRETVVLVQITDSRLLTEVGPELAEERLQLLDVGVGGRHDVIATTAKKQGLEVL